MELLKVWTSRLEGRHISVVSSGHNNDIPKGGKAITIVLLVYKTTLGGIH